MKRICQVLSVCFLFLHNDLERTSGRNRSCKKNTFTMSFHLVKIYEFLSLLIQVPFYNNLILTILIDFVTSSNLAEIYSK